MGCGDGAWDVVMACTRGGSQDDYFRVGQASCHGDVGWGGGNGWAGAWNGGMGGQGMVTRRLCSSRPGLYSWCYQRVSSNTKS